MIQISKGGPHLTPIINQPYGRIRLSYKIYSIKMLNVKFNKKHLKKSYFEFGFLNRS